MTWGGKSHVQDWQDCISQHEQCPLGRVTSHAWYKDKDRARGQGQGRNVLQVTCIHGMPWYALLCYAVAWRGYK